MWKKKQKKQKKKAEDDYIDPSKTENPTKDYKLENLENNPIPADDKLIDLTTFYKEQNCVRMENIRRNFYATKFPLDEKAYFTSRETLGSLNTLVDNVNKKIALAHPNYIEEGDH